MTFACFQNITTKLLGATIAALLLVLLALATSAGAATQTGSDSVGFGVTPLRIDVEAKPGESSTHAITITNADEVATRFTFSKEDFAGDKDEPAATPVLLGGKFQSSISGHDWIDAPGAITIPAGQSRTIKVTVNVPSGATGGHYAALMVSGAERSAGRIVAKSRVGVLFMMNAGGVPPPEIVITEVQEVGPGRTVTEFINRGKTETRPRGTITRDPVGPGRTRRTVGTCTTALPGGSGQCVFKHPSGGKTGFLPIGPVQQYVDIVGDPGGEGTSARGDLPTEWAGNWTSLLLPLVGVALFILYFLFLRRRRKDDEDTDEFGHGYERLGLGVD